MVTREDLLITLCIGVHVAKVDDRFDELEKRLLGQLAGLMKLTDEEKSSFKNRKETLSELLERLSSTEAIIIMIKTICLVAHSDGKVLEVEQNFLEKMLKKVDTEFSVLQSDRWGSYDTDVRGAFMFFAR
ncbi:MAG: TerB family tellurite resistance protein [SAR324 cluster bacterium]|nr:TerB family tellurite resistance protein [SAR324 cluster bacterium]